MICNRPPLTPRCRRGVCFLNPLLRYGAARLKSEAEDGAYVQRLEATYRWTGDVLRGLFVITSAPRFRSSSFRSSAICSDDFGIPTSQESCL